MSMKTFYTDGLELKNIELPAYPDSAWTFYTEAPSDQEDELYGLVATVFRAVNMTADATATLPFSIMRAGGEDEIDSSNDYQNVVGWMPDPFDLLRRWRASWSMSNAAYGFMESITGQGKKLRYIVSNTITPEYDQQRGIYQFLRKVGNKQIPYPYKQGATSNRVVPLYILDHTTELLPSKETEFKAAMNAAGILYYTDFFVKQFFKRGGIVPSLVAVKGVLTDTQADKVERGVSAIMRNIYKYMVKTINADALQVTPLGQSVEVLKDNALYEQSIANVAMAFGMPLSMLLSNSATYATALEEKKTWFSNKVVPDAIKMQAALNRELFEPYGFHFEFNYEASDEGTQEEVDRAQAFQTYVNAGIRPGTAAQIVGIELPEGMEAEDLDKMREEDQQRKAEEQQRQFEQQEKLRAANRPQGGPPRPPAPTSRRSFLPDMEQARELVNWQTLANRKAKKGKLDELHFEIETLPAEIAEQVQTGLKACKTVDDVSAVFEAITDAETVTDAPIYKAPQDTEIKALADALNKLAERNDPQPLNVNITTPPTSFTLNEKAVTVTPEVKAEPAIVNVTVPTAEPPIVNITNEVETPVVNVTNDVQPAPVKVQGKKRAKLLRDNEGRVTGIESE